MAHKDKRRSIVDLNVLKVDSPFLRYGVAIFSALLALLLTELIESLRDRTPFPLFFAAVAVSAWYGGIGPGLLATALSALITEYFFLLRAEQFIIGLGSSIQLIVFVLVSILISSLDTARKRAEKETRDRLRESNERYSSLWEHAEDPMLRIDLEKKVIAVNKRVEDVIGIAGEEILGSSIYCIFPDKHYQAFDEIFRYTLEGNKADTAEIEILTGDKRSITMELDMRGVLGGSIVQSVQIHLRDVSKRKEIEQELINSARFATVGELTAKLAHEVNNPLGIILGFSQEILSEIDDNNPHYRSVKIITEEAKRCKNVMKHLLAFARPPSLKYSSVEIEEIIKESLELVLGILDKRGILIKKMVPANSPKLYANQSQIKAVLLNLYNNAIDAMPQGGELTVSVSLNVTTAKISVSDTGEGINEIDLNSIFMPYFTTKEGGTGLGLCISKRIIEGHNGKLEVESKPGIGTSFIITLPVEGKSGEAKSDKGQGVHEK
jgi:two-component system, sporulation sensor kinase E